MLVVVGRDRCDGRLFHLFDCRVVALFLVDAGKAVAEELFGIADDVCFGQFGYPADFLYFPLPVLVVDESVHELVGTELVLVELCVVVSLVVVDDGRQQVVGELSFFQLLYLGQCEAAYLRQGLSRL